MDHPHQGQFLDLCCDLAPRKRGHQCLGQLVAMAGLVPIFFNSCIPRINIHASDSIQYYWAINFRISSQTDELTTSYGSSPMFLVRRLKGLIPSPMDHPHQAQFLNSYCANADPQLHERLPFFLSIKTDQTAPSTQAWHRQLLSYFEAL